jgi:hypothetical protein
MNLLPRSKSFWNKTMKKACKTTWMISLDYGTPKNMYSPTH